MIFESVMDLYETHTEDFMIAFKDELDDFRKDYVDENPDENEVLGAFINEYLTDQHLNPYFKFAEHWIKKNKYKATIVDIKYFGEDVEENGVAKYVIDIQQVIPATREDLQEIVEVYMEFIGASNMAEIVMEKICPEERPE